MTPISLPRFSNGNTRRTPSISDNSRVRCAHASTTVRARRYGRSRKFDVTSGVKQTTSQRARAGRRGNSSSPSTSAAKSSGTSMCMDSDGKRFSKTTTS